MEGKGRIMTIEEANAIELEKILEKIGAKLTKQSANEIWYLSPFRQEKTASFHVCKSKNIWNDFGEVRGGKVIDFLCLYLERQLEDHTIQDALRWLKNMHLSPCKLEELIKYEKVD